MKLKILCCASMVLALYGIAHTAGVRYSDVQPTYNQEGDAPVMFNVVCDSSSWTVLAASDTIRRSLTIVPVPGNIVGVCVGTITTTAYACGDTVPGVEITTGTASFTDYTTAKWTCRSRASDASLQRLRGYSSRDKRDYGNIDNKGLQ